LGRLLQKALDIIGDGMRQGIQCSGVAANGHLLFLGQLRRIKTELKAQLFKDRFAHPLSKRGAFCHNL
jgi:hypothetical protein